MDKPTPADMNRTYILLPLADGLVGAFSEPVAAEIIPEIAPHLAHVLTPALHKLPWWPGGWAVSDVETGQAIHTDGRVSYSDKDLAALMACERLERCTPDDIERAFAKSKQMRPWVCK